MERPCIVLTFPNRIVCRGVSGLLTGFPCCLSDRWLTTCPMSVNFFYANILKINEFGRSKEWKIVPLYYVYIYIYIERERERYSLLRNMFPLKYLTLVYFYFHLSNSFTLIYVLCTSIFHVRNFNITPPYFMSMASFHNSSQTEFQQSMVVFDCP